MKKVVIVGSGFGGLVSCINIDNKKNKIILLEKDNDIGKKILVTGNGKCNFWNEDMSNKHFHSDEEQLINSILTDKAKMSAFSFIDTLNIEYKVKNGYYYPFSNNASTIRNTFIYELNKKNVEVRINYEVKSIKKIDSHFLINDDIICDMIILSTGGKSYTANENSYIYDILRSFGHEIIKPLPSLVQLLSDIKYKKYWHGIRTDAEVLLKIDNRNIKKEKGEIQLTDKGISGICVFNISREASIAIDKNKKVEVLINFIPFCKDAKKYIIERVDKLRNVSIYDNLCRVLNNKIVDIIFEESRLKKNIYSLSDNELDRICSNLISFKVNITSTMPFISSQVTRGGVSLKDLNIKSFESKKVNNMYIIGELTDVDGDCGGYNIAYAIISSLIAVGDINDKS